MALNMSVLRKAEEAVRRRFADAKPLIGCLLGSGLAAASDVFHVIEELDYADIPGLGRPTVKGHAGRLTLAECEGLQAFVFEGRRHWYEGEGWEPVAIPVFLLKSFSARILVVTNVAAGIRKDLAPGRIMLIDDHINAMGAHPLIGERDSFWGPRFPDQSAVYDPELRAVVDEAAANENRDIAHGVYLAVAGPAYETPAEIRAFRTMGADAVGMSTVPEASLAGAAGMRVLGVSCIVNRAAGLSSATLKHDEVTREAGKTAPALRWLLTAFLSRMAERLGASRVESMRRRGAARSTRVRR